MVEERSNRETTFKENNDDLFKIRRFGPNQKPSLKENATTEEIIEYLNMINFRLNVLECYNPKILNFTESLKKDLYDEDQSVALQMAQKILREK